MTPPIALDATIQRALQANAVVAISVSGGKDSDSCAIATDRYLDSIGHDPARRLLIHADLGQIEWSQTRDQCAHLARHLGRQLITVERPAGGMIERWQRRWELARARYATLRTVHLVSPWSSKNNRFCTSELKSQPIARKLVSLFSNTSIISVTGIRRQESIDRRQTPISSTNDLLRRIRRRLTGLTWNPIVDWTVADVVKHHETEGFPLHEAYTRFGSTRLSCAFCVLASGNDLAAATKHEPNLTAYRSLVELELASGFSFQPSRWLADVALPLLSAETSAALQAAKERAEQRRLLERRIPKALLYTKGWPTTMPTLEEASLLADVSRQVARDVSLDIDYATGPAVRDRIADLIALNPRSAPIQAAPAQYTLAIACGESGRPAAAH